MDIRDTAICSLNVSKDMIIDKNILYKKFNSQNDFVISYSKFSNSTG